MEINGHTVRGSSVDVEGYSKAYQIEIKRTADGATRGKWELLGGSVGLCDDTNKWIALDDDTDEEYAKESSKTKAIAELLKVKADGESPTPVNDSGSEQKPQPKVVVDELELDKHDYPTSAPIARGTKVTTGDDKREGVATMMYLNDITGDWRVNVLFDNGDEKWFTFGKDVAPIGGMPTDEDEVADEGEEDEWDEDEVLGEEEEEDDDDDDDDE